MAFSRRRFMQWAGSVSTLAIAGPAGTRSLSLLAGNTADTLRPGLLPSRKKVWDDLAWMAKLGPKYTGNKAHTTFIEFLATELKATGLDVARDRYTFPRWDARRSEITITPFPSSEPAFKAPVTSYFPYSGQTPVAGVTGELVYAGSNPKFNASRIRGRVHRQVESRTASQPDSGIRESDSQDRYDDCRLSERNLTENVGRTTP